MYTGQDGSTLGRGEARHPPPITNQLCAGTMSEAGTATTDKMDVTPRPRNFHANKREIPITTQYDNHKSWVSAKETNKGLRSELL